MGPAIDYEKIYESIIGDVGNYFESGESYEELDTKDPFQTADQRKRDKLITKLLSDYIDNYKNKIDDNRKYRWAILIGAGVVLLAIISICAFLSIKIFSKEQQEIASLITLISSYLTFGGVTIGVLKIITEYVFPKDEEQYISRIVESIQNNDLEHKKENIKVAFHNDENKYRGYKF